MRRARSREEIVEELERLREALEEVQGLLSDALAGWVEMFERHGSDPGFMGVVTEQAESGYQFLVAPASVKQFPHSVSEVCRGCCWGDVTCAPLRQAFSKVAEVERLLGVAEARLEKVDSRLVRGSWSELLWASVHMRWVREEALGDIGRVLDWLGSAASE